MFLVSVLLKLFKKPFPGEFWVTLIMYFTSSLSVSINSYLTFLKITFIYLKKKNPLSIKNINYWISNW